MNILITGASGLLGNHLTRTMLSGGHHVRALIESEKEIYGIDSLPVERYVCDLRKASQVKGSASGMDIIIHAAADTSIWPCRSKNVSEVNIRGTQLMIEEALAHDVKKFIYVSSASAFGAGTKQNPGTENNYYDRFKYYIDYFESKYIAQEAVLNAVHKRNLPAVIVNPTFMIGPYDFNLNASRLILSIMKKKIPGCSPGGRNFVYAHDVAVAISNAIMKGEIGECYILGNDNLSYREFFEMVGAVTSSKVPTLNIPKPLVLIAGFALSIWAAISGKPPILEYNLARGSCYNSFYCSEKALNNLNLPQTPISTAISHTVDWLRDQKLI
jgi:dihydroflavonol-4-reductase